MDISAWWSSKELFEQIYWLFALPATAAFLFIMVTTFLGGDIETDTDVDAGIDGDDGIGFQFFTIKNLVGFFAIFGWSGLSCIDAELGTMLTIVISVFSGMVMMTIMAGIFYFLSTLSDSGSLNLSKNAIGAVGEVYLPVKANRDGFGKIQINIQGGLRTLQAMTDDKEDLQVGKIVTVLGVLNENILIVTKHKK